MAYEKLKQLLGDDFQQLNSEELKTRLGERTRDFNPKTLPSIMNNDNYNKAVNNKAAGYYNDRVDMLQTAELKDTQPNISKEELMNLMAKRYSIKNVPTYNEVPNLMSMDGTSLSGAYVPESNDLFVNSNSPRDSVLSTIMHEMKHAANSNAKTNDLQTVINKATIPVEYRSTRPDSLKAAEENSYTSDSGQVEQDILDNNFKAVSDKYNRGHFFGTDQVEDVANRTYNPTGWKKLADKIK